MAILPDYQPKDITAEAPTPLVSGGQIAQGGQDIAQGEQALGRGLDQLSVPFAEQAGAEAAQVAVTRAPDGTPQVATPSTSFIMGRAGEAYGAAVQAGETAHLHTLIQTDFADMATKFQLDPEGFKQAAGTYMQSLTSPMTNSVMKGAVSDFGNELAAQHYGGLVDQNANVHVKNSYDALNTQVDAQKNELFALARGGGTGTPEFAQASQKLGALYDSLGGNPIFQKFGVTPDSIAADRKSINDQAFGEAMIGHLDQTVTKQGIGAAQKSLEDGILNNPSLTLSDTQRNVLYREGLARLGYLSGQNKAQVDASRIGVNMTVEALAKGATIPDSLLDQMQSQSSALGDTESVQKLQAQRQAARAARPLNGLNADQRTGAIMGGGDYMTSLHATENPSGDPYASPGTSSSLGPNQFTAGTWAQVSAAHPDLGLTPNGRTDAEQNAKAIAAFTTDNRTFLQGKGIDPNDKNTYMAHFLGAGGGAQFIEAMRRDPAQTAASLFPQQASANRGVFYNADGSARSLSDTYNFATRKFGPGTTPLAPASANGNPFTPDQYAANPFLASAYVREIASDGGAQVRYGKGLLTSIQQGLKNGYMPSPETLGSAIQLANQNPDKLGDQASQVKSYLAGAAQAAQAEGQGGSQARTILAQAEQAAQGGSIMQQKIAEGVRDWTQRSDANLKSDPFNEAVARGWLAKPVDPLNFQDQTALANAIHQRGIASTIIGSRTGAGPQSAFSPAELAQVKALVTNPSTDANTRINVLGALTQNLPPDVLRKTMGQIAGDKVSAPFAVAGDLSTKNPSAAFGLLQGQAAMAANPSLLPKAGQWPGEMSSRMPMSDFPNTTEWSAIDQSVKAYYAKLSADANDTSQTVDKDRMDQAVHDVTGGILDSGKSKVFAPWYNASQGDLDTAVKSLSDVDFKNARTSNGSPFSAANLKPGTFFNSPWRLMSAGDGKYRVVTGAPDRPNPLLDVTTGRPFALDLGKGHAPAPQQASSMASIEQPAPAQNNQLGAMNAAMTGQ